MHLIERSVPFTFTRDMGATTGDGLTLDGYAATFGSPTLIDSWEGYFNEQIQSGAFRKSIRERTPILQFDHGQHPLIGSIPIGAISALEEDQRGLHVQARLVDNWLIQPVRDAIANRSIDGMSFRFYVVRDTWTDVNGVAITDPNELRDLLYDPGQRGPLNRTLIEVKCEELGPVVWPAYKDTTVGVRARSIASEIRGDVSMRRNLLAELRGMPVQVDDDEPDEVDKVDEQDIDEVDDDAARAEYEFALTELGERGDPKKPYGNVTYADPGYQSDGKKRYPLDTAAHVKAAWSYINQSDNAAKYTADQLSKIKASIKAAAKKLGVTISDSAANSAQWAVDGMPARDVALALLFGDTMRDAPGVPPSRHPSGRDETKRDAPPSGHPSTGTTDVEDAPLPDEHPSNTEPSRLDPARLKRDAAFRADYLTLIFKGSDEYDA